MNNICRISIPLWLKSYLISCKNECLYYSNIDLNSLSPQLVFCGMSRRPIYLSECISNEQWCQWPGAYVCMLVDSLWSFAGISISENYFSARQVSNTEGRETVCTTLDKITVVRKHWILNMRRDIFFLLLFYALSGRRLLFPVYWHVPRHKTSRQTQR